MPVSPEDLQDLKPFAADVASPDAPQMSGSGASPPATSTGSSRHGVNNYADFLQFSADQPQWMTNPNTRPVWEQYGNMLAEQEQMRTRAAISQTTLERQKIMLDAQRARLANTGTAAKVNQAGAKEFLDEWKTLPAAERSKIRWNPGQEPTADNWTALQVAQAGLEQQRQKEEEGLTAGGLVKTAKTDPKTGRLVYEWKPKPRDTYAQKDEQLWQEAVQSIDPDVAKGIATEHGFDSLVDEAGNVREEAKPFINKELQRQGKPTVSIQTPSRATSKTAKDITPTQLKELDEALQSIEGRPDSPLKTAMINAAYKSLGIDPPAPPKEPVLTSDIEGLKKLKTGDPVKDPKSGKVAPFNKEKFDAAIAKSSAPPKKPEPADPITENEFVKTLKEENKSTTKTNSAIKSLAKQIADKVPIGDEFLRLGGSVFKSSPETAYYKALTTGKYKSLTGDQVWDYFRKLPEQERYEMLRKALKDAGIEQPMPQRVSQYVSSHDEE